MGSKVWAVVFYSGGHVIKETILFTGPDSSGKTTCLLEIAEHHPNAKVYVIDIENKMEKIWKGLFPQVENIKKVFNPKNWDEVEAAFKECKADLQVNDWLMVEAMDKMWDFAQADYDKRMLGKTPGEVIEASKTKEGKDPGIDKWAWVKTKHNFDFIDTACFQAPFNVAATSQAQAFTPTIETGSGVIREDPELFDLYKPIGFKAGGEKHNHSRFDTIIALNVHLTPKRRHQVATIKDKVRPYFVGEKGVWLDFEWPLWPKYVEMCKKAQKDGQKVIIPV